MKKIFLAICILLVIHSASKAQLSITPHVSPAFPSGTFNNFAGNGLGFGIGGTYDVTDNLRIGASIDRYKFNAKVLGFNIGNLIGGFNFNITPITGSVQYFLPGEVLRPYVGIEAGVYNFSVNKFANINRTYFGLAPVAGILYPVSDRLDFFANAKYQTMFVNEGISLIIRDLNIKQNIHFIPINVGISFKFNH